MKTVGNSITNPQIHTGIAGQAGALQKSEEADKAGPSASAAARLREGVNVSLSPQARELIEARQKALEIARDTPDVREDRVAELKQKIQEGAYKVDAGNIADGMLREAIKDRLAADLD